MNVFLFFCSFIFSLFGGDSSKNLPTSKSVVGKWQVVSYDYKQASNPQKDYMLSRNDFEVMVKLKATYELKADGTAIQSIGDWTQEYVYEVVNGNIKMYPCGNLKAKETCIKLSKQAHDYNDYGLEGSNDKLSFSQSNNVFLLKINLTKLK